MLVAGVAEANLNLVADQGEGAFQRLLSLFHSPSFDDELVKSFLMSMPDCEKAADRKL